MIEIATTTKARIKTNVKMWTKGLASFGLKRKEATPEIPIRKNQ